MKKLWIKLGACALALMMAMVFAGCDGGTTTRYIRTGSIHVTPVRDDVIETIGWGHHRINPINVTTYFQNNQIVRISIGQHSESAAFIESVRDTFIPRVLYLQRLGDMPTDAVSGATLSTMGVREAVMEAITEAGGRPQEWAEAFPIRDTDTPGLDVLFDVIVVGLGGAGTMAYLAASEVEFENEAGNMVPVSVLGLEAAAQIGGMSAHVMGSTVVGSSHIIPSGEFDAILGQWHVSSPFPGLYRNYWRDQRHAPPTPRHQPPNLWGGADRDIVEWFIQDTGDTVDWLIDNHGFTFGSVAFGGGAVIAMIQPGAAGNRNRLFHWAIQDASRRNSASTYATEMRAVRLLPPSTNSDYYTITVRNTRTGREFPVMGRSVVLTTGGFLANAEMMRHYFGVSTPMQTIYTQRGDGIMMGRQVGAATYNIRMPFVGNQATVVNIIRRPIPRQAAQDPRAPELWRDGLRWKNTVASMLLTPNAMTVAMEVAFNGVDGAGQRFMPESAGAVGARWWGSGGFFATIYCAARIDQIRANGFMAEEPTTSFVGQNIGGAMFNPETGENPTNAFAAGHPIPEIDYIINWAVSVDNAIRATDLADLARQLSLRSATASATITEARLRETIERYNYLIGRDEDLDWGKSGMAARPTISLEGPFVAFLGAGHFYGTSGGLDVDINMNVLDPYNDPIPGLFAGGQDSMGVIFHADEGYGPSGSANAWALTSGRWAGINAARAARGLYLEHDTSN